VLESVVVVLLLVLGASLEHADRMIRAATPRHWTIIFFMIEFLVLFVICDAKLRPRLMPHHGV
jgi:hypothetical protein